MFIALPTKRNQTDRNRSYGVEQFCMMCFALLSSNSHISSESRATMGLASSRIGQRSFADGLDATSSALSKDTLLITQNLLQQFGGKPAAVERGTSNVPFRPKIYC